jgi:hypothetical protein
MLRNKLISVVLSMFGSLSAVTTSAEPGKGKPGGGGNQTYRVEVTVGPGRIQALPAGTVFEGTIDEEPGDGAGARLSFKTGRNELMQFDFEGDCAVWIEGHGLPNLVRDSATVDVRLVVGMWGEMASGSSGHEAHIKVNPDTKGQEFWWVLRYDQDFSCAGCVNESGNASVSRASDGSWTITGDLAWVHDNFDRSDGANCSMPFEFRVRRP